MGCVSSLDIFLGYQTWLIILNNCSLDGLSFFFSYNFEIETPKHLLQKMEKLTFQLKKHRVVSATLIAKHVYACTLVGVMSFKEEVLKYQDLIEKLLIFFLPSSILVENMCISHCYLVIEVCNFILICMFNVDLYDFIIIMYH